MPSQFHPSSSPVLVIDQDPLIRDAKDACQRACAAIASLKAQLHQFEATDVPAYDRWYHSTFGRYLTEIRELTALVVEKERLLTMTRKKHWERFFGSARGVAMENPEYARRAEHGDGFAGAYASWGFSEVDGEELNADNDDEEESSDDLRYQEDGYHDDEQDYHYDEDEDYVRRFEDLFVKRGESGGYYRSRSGSDERGRGGAGAKGPNEGKSSGDSRDASKESETPSPAQELRARLKERYRILVRRLHPDLNPELSVEEKSLWNQVQLAYHQRNLEQMDICLALSEAFSGEISESTNLDQLRRASREIERLILPLERKLDQARENPAWKFSDSSNRDPLRKTIEREFMKDLAKLRHKLAQVDTQIHRFARNATRDATADL